MLVYSQLKKLKLPLCVDQAKKLESELDNRCSLGHQFSFSIYYTDKYFQKEKKKVNSTCKKAMDSAPDI